MRIELVIRSNDIYPKSGKKKNWSIDDRTLALKILISLALDNANIGRK